MSDRTGGRSGLAGRSVGAGREVGRGWPGGRPGLAGRSAGAGWSGKHGRERTAIVTGGASGIGGAISRRLAADGAAVAIFDLNGDAAKAAAVSIEESGGKAIGVPVDVTDRPGIDAGLDEVRARLGRPTILMNSAGITVDGPFLEITAETWNRVLAINLTGTFHCCQAVLPGMIEAGWGRIVNISSSSIHSGSPKMAAYVASKSGVVGLTKVLALEFSRHGITVNTIPPGFIDTPMLRQTVERGFISVEQQTEKTPVGRIGQPEDVAAACAFLVSEGASYITGQIIGVNGGRNT
jgi:NAD(P)-dependent dehydrogenase (short-subunit alcohol dehydrogenase family)